MRLLHTGDWHVGKVLKGVSRLDEHRAVLAELVQLAERERVDVVLVAGDVFESAAPTADAQQLAWATLLALRDTGAHVVAIAGNHDSAEGFDAVSPVFAAAGITVVGRLRRTDAGGVVDVHSRDGVERAQVALVPFVSQRGAVRAAQLLELDAAEMAQEYAARVQGVVTALTSLFAPDTVNVVLAHGTLRGGVLGGGERDAQTTNDYALSGTAFPASASYAALGHLHRVQQLPGPCPLWYSGSPIAVDFGEQDDVKHVLLVEAAPGRPARVEPRPLQSPRRLRTIRGTVADLTALAATVGEDLLRVYVAEPGRAGLADEIRALLPNALEVRVEPPADRTSRAPRRGQQDPHSLFAAFLTEQNIADARLEALFAALLDDALVSGGP